MVTNTTKPTKSALELAMDRAHEQLVDRLAKKAAKGMVGHIRFLGGESPAMKILSEEFKKSARRQVN